MKVFNPPIEKRTNEELIAIANSTTNDWQKEAVEQAKAEIVKRNPS